MISKLLKAELGLFLSISLGIFLFVLFFQPFPLENFNPDNLLLFKAGLGAIIFLFTFLNRIVFPPFIKDFQKTNKEARLPYLSGPTLQIVLSSTAFAFYLRYVGMVHITFPTMFKVVIICASPLVILYIHDLLKTLYYQNNLLNNEKKTLLQQIEKAEEDYLSKTIEFISDYQSENIVLSLADILLIKSADNYVEIIYKEGQEFKKHLIRNTLKNIEVQLKGSTFFVRCHRICIVNVYHIEKLDKSQNNYFLSFKNYTEKIPVSRQYLLKIKEYIQ